MVARLLPLNIAQIGSELAISWNDGEEGFFPLEALRRVCPCATCGGEPDVMGNLTRPRVTYSPDAFHLAGWQIVGGYAWQPTWQDSHSTGLYAFSYLRRLASGTWPGWATAHE